MSRWRKGDPLLALTSSDRLARVRRGETSTAPECVAFLRRLGLERRPLDTLDALALGIAAFHADSPSTSRVATYGAPEIIERNEIETWPRGLVQ